MAEDKRSNPYPFPTAADVESAPGDRETKAARNIMVRNIPGIPRRPYLMGDSDHAPILLGVKDLTTACYRVLDALDGRFEDSSEADALDGLRAILEDHGCPAEAPLTPDA